jgi:magnesium chelatase subunit D
VGPIFKASDLRHKRYEIGSDRLLIFTVDASGSAAVARLAEAKGAVELLLGEAYARRDHVALYAFRGTGSEALLPPTRSLVQTKKRLAALPWWRSHALSCRACGRVSTCIARTAQWSDADVDFAN